MKNAYNQGLECDHEEENGDDGISPKDVGHNIYILAHQVCLCLLVLGQLPEKHYMVKLHIVTGRVMPFRSKREVTMCLLIKTKVW